VKACACPARNQDAKRRFPTRLVGRNIKRNTMALQQKVVPQATQDVCRRKSRRRRIRSPFTHGSPAMSKNPLARTRRAFLTSLRPSQSRLPAAPTRLPLPRATLHQFLTQDHPRHTVPRQHHRHQSTDQPIPCNRHLVSIPAFSTAPTMFKLMAGLLTTTIIKNTNRHTMPIPEPHRRLGVITQVPLSYQDHRCPPQGPPSTSTPTLAARVGTRRALHQS
jgi:hypothetical protein